MSESLENFIRDNRDAFEQDGPSAGLWERIAPRLTGPNVPDQPALNPFRATHRSPTWTRSYWTWAASVALLLLTGGLWWVNDRYRPTSQADVVAFSPTYAREVAQYASLIDIKHTELQELKTQLGNQLMALELGMYQSAVVRKQLTKLISEIDNQLAECAKLIEKAIADNAEWKRKVEQICAIKGVGILTVAQVLTETNEFGLFENQRQLVSYAGYDVVENQSGKRVGKTRISKRGNSRIRRAMHMSALQVVRYEQRPFVGLYERVFERTKIKMKGYVAVQRKLLTLIYALWKKDQKYDGAFVSEGQKKVAPTEGATLHRPQVDVLEKTNIGELVES